jgi:PhzF family phenazine biosynthesis protein
MKRKIYQIDAFADKVFSGNPAAICPLEKWLPDALLQKIAMENNLSETAFYVKQGDQYQLRWFTPIMEVDLCGHATLAAAFVLHNYENHKEPVIHFYSPRSGALTVTKNADHLTLNFPADTLQEIALTGEMANCFNTKAQLAFMGKSDLLLVYDSEAEIRNLIPAFDFISKLNVRGVIVTAKGDQMDFVSRFFAPKAGIREDPVTGSAHTSLTPYWAKRLGKTELTAIQLSARKGYLQCTHLSDRVEISGSAKLYMIGDIYLE